MSARNPNHLVDTQPGHQNTHRARRALEKWGRNHPDISRMVDAVRAERRKGWPEYIFLPVDTALEIMRWYLPDAREQSDARRNHALAINATQLQFFSAWRVTQGIYRFDPTLYEQLRETSITGSIPGEVLLRLPEWCVYLETPGMTMPQSGSGETPLHGVWAWLDREAERGRPLLKFTFDADPSASVDSGQVWLDGTIEQAIQEAEVALPETMLKDYTRMARSVYSSILSLLLYLCAENAEIGEDHKRPPCPQPKRTKGIERLFPADKPREWNVGTRMGAALRRAHVTFQTDSMHPEVQTGQHVRPHVRRAHWHTYRAGPGRTDRRVKWLPPIPVNVDDYDKLPAVIRPLADEYP